MNLLDSLAKLATIEPGLANGSLCEIGVFLASAAETPYTIVALATLFESPVPRITRTTSRLERLGLVKRRRNPFDTREVYVEVTPRGRVVLEEIGYLGGRDV